MRVNKAMQTHLKEPFSKELCGTVGDLTISLHLTEPAQCACVISKQHHRILVPGTLCCRKRIRTHKDY
jgi:hypothetical protein